MNAHSCILNVAHDCNILVQVTAEAEPLIILHMVNVWQKAND